MLARMLFCGFKWQCCSRPARSGASCAQRLSVRCSLLRRASEELQQALNSLAARQAGDAGSSAVLSSSSGGSSNGDSGGGQPTAAALDGALYTRGCPPVDLLVRTSGETRLSDFLLWQCRHALLVFTAVLWPEFGFLDLVAAVQEYQRQHPHLQRLRAAAEAAAAARGRAPAAAQAAAAAAAAAVHPQSSGPWARLLPAKLAAAGECLQRGSPCGIASPPSSPSSPSSRSEGSAEEASLAGAAAAAAAMQVVAAQSRRRRAAAPL